MAIRSMAPKVIVADEIGSSADIDAINYAVCSGVKGIFTAHSFDFESMKLNKELNNLINMKLKQLMEQVNLLIQHIIKLY